jgi:hypothetical protein
MPAIAWARSFSPAFAATKMRSVSIERLTPVWPAGNRDQASSRTSPNMFTVLGSKNAGVLDITSPSLV